MEETLLIPPYRVDHQGNSYALLNAHGEALLPYEPREIRALGYNFYGIHSPGGWRIYQPGDLRNSPCHYGEVKPFEGGYARLISKRRSWRLLPSGFVEPDYPWELPKGFSCSIPPPSRTGRASSARASASA